MMHWDLIRVQGCLHAHRVKLRNNVLGRIGFLNRTAHSPIPFRMAIGNECFCVILRLCCIIRNQFIFVIRLKSKPCWLNDKYGGDHQDRDADCDECRRSKDFSTPVPRHRLFTRQNGVINEGLLRIQTDSIGLGVVCLETLDKLSFGPAYGQFSLTQHLFEFVNGQSFET